MLISWVVYIAKMWILKSCSYYPKPQLCHRLYVHNPSLWE